MPRVETVPAAGPLASDDRGLDAELVRQVSEGKGDALASLFDRHAQSIFSMAVRLGHDRSMAADVVQETFLALWNRAELFDPSRGSLRAWLLTIARNRAVDHVRAEARRGRSLPFSAFDDGADDGFTTAEWLATSGRPLGMASPDAGPETAVSAKETRDDVAAAIDSLNPFERSVILLAYGNGLSQTEIAAHTGWPLGTVKTRTKRALRRLRAAMERPMAPQVPILEVRAASSDNGVSGFQCSSFRRSDRYAKTVSGERRMAMDRV